jgi:hypothetical protein
MTNHSPLRALDRAKRAKKKRPGEPDLTAEETAEIQQLAQHVQTLEGLRDKAEFGSDRYDDLDYAVFKHKERIDALIARLQPRTLVGRAGTAHDLWRTWLTSGDFLPFFRQQYFGLASHPFVTMKSAPTFKQAFFSEKEAFKLDAQLRRATNADLYVKYDIGLTDPTTKLSQREDALMTSTAEQLPVLKNYQRAFRVNLNHHRADMFDTLVDAWGGRDKLDDQHMQTIADFVRNVTGRGDLGNFEASARGMAQVFLSPRFFVSRLKVGSGYPLARAVVKGDKFAAKLWAREYARALAGTAAFAAIAVGAGKAMFGPENVEYVINPLDNNVGRLRIGGRWIDVTGGLGRAARLANTIVGGIYDTVTGAKDRQKNQEQAILGTIRGALAPGPGSVASLAFGQTFGQPVTPGSFAIDYGLPFSPTGVVQALQDEGLERGAAIGAFELFGGGSFAPPNR